MDWRDGGDFDQPPALVANVISAKGGRAPAAGWPNEPVDPFGWSSGDVDALCRCKILLSADCIYDDNLTSALVQTLAKLLPVLHLDAVCLVALERRFNFCLEGFRSRAPAAEHFEHAMRAHSHLDMIRLHAEGIPQRFEYDRGPDLELWKVFHRSNVPTSSPRA